jgi:hypothetical protein
VRRNNEIAHKVVCSSAPGVCRVVVDELVGHFHYVVKLVFPISNGRFRTLLVSSEVKIPNAIGFLQ